MKNHWVFALSMAVMWGIVFANALHDTTTSICMGLLMGMAFRLFDCSGDVENTDEERK